MLKFIRNYIADIRAYYARQAQLRAQLNEFLRDCLSEEEHRVLRLDMLVRHNQEYIKSYLMEEAYRLRMEWWNRNRGA